MFNKNQVEIKRLKSKKKSNWGWGLIIFFGMALIGGFIDFDPTEIPVMIFCVALIMGAYFLLCKKADGVTKLCNKFDEYSAILMSDDTRSLNTVVANTNDNIDEVVNNIKAMIDMGWFVNAYIDFEHKCVVFSNFISKKDNISENSEKEVVKKYKNVVCSNCGARTTVLEGTIGECEYCGSKINA